MRFWNSFFGDSDNTGNTPENHSDKKGKNRLLGLFSSKSPKKEALRTRKLALEQFENRELLSINGPQLNSIFINQDETRALDTESTLNIAPTSFLMRFSEGKVIDPSSLAGIEVYRAGGDGIFDSNDIKVGLGYIGIGDNSNEVIVRFAENLPDDLYQFRIIGGDTNPGALRSMYVNPITGEITYDGFYNPDGLTEATKDAQTVPFTLQLGAKVTSIVTQPTYHDNHITFSSNSTQKVGDKFTIYDGVSAPVRFVITASGTTPGAIVNGEVSVPYSSSPQTQAKNLFDAIESQVVNSKLKFDLDTYVSGSSSVVFRSATASCVNTSGTPLSFSDEAKLNQDRNTIEVYFTDDELKTLSNGQLDPKFFQLFVTNNTLDPNDDVLVLPKTVDYKYNVVVDGKNVNRAILTFDDNLDEFGTGSFRLRIGDYYYETETHVIDLMNSETVIGDTFKTSYPISSNIFDTGKNEPQSLIIHGQINRQYDPVEYPGYRDDPGHRDLPYDAGYDGDNHISDTPDSQSGTNYRYYNFMTDLGANPAGGRFTNMINEAQKELTRMIFDMYSRYLGIQFIESENQGITVATGDLAWLGGQSGGPVAGLGGGDSAIMDGTKNWGADVYGGGWFGVAIHEIGHCLGLGHTYDLAEGTDMGSDGEGNNIPQVVEKVYPGLEDIIHGQHLYRPDSNDIDMYEFNLDQGGKFSAEVFAQRANAASELNADLKLYKKVIEDLPGGGTFVTYELVAQNNDYFGKDSFLELYLDAGTYYIAVTSTGNDDINPQMSGTGGGGLTLGNYELRLNFTARGVDSGNAKTFKDQTGSYLTDKNDVKFDGDNDMVPGGAYDYWFNVQKQTDNATSSDLDTINRTIYVDNLTRKYNADGTVVPIDPLRTRDPDLIGDGTISNPFKTIEFALERASQVQKLLEDAGYKDTSVIVRIVGNNFNGDNYDTDNPNNRTLRDNKAYEIGVNSQNNNSTLTDGARFDIPKGVSVIIDAGVVIKMGQANITVGSSALNVDRSGGSLQLLGNPVHKVLMTSYFDESVGRDTYPLTTTQKAGQWGGIVIRNDLDNEFIDNYDAKDGRPRREVLENQGIFLNYINNADLRYGGGEMQDKFTYTPIHVIDARPTLTFNTITHSANAAISATPNSFEETRYQNWDHVEEHAFTTDYSRVGLHVHGNILTANVTNGLLVHVFTPVSTSTVKKVEVAARFDDLDVVHVLTENLVISGQVGGNILTQPTAPSLNFGYGSLGYDNVNISTDRFMDQCLNFSTVPEDGEYFSISDGETKVTFEFNRVNVTGQNINNATRAQAGRVVIDILSNDTLREVVRKTIAAINAVRNNEEVMETYSGKEYAKYLLANQKLSKDQFKISAQTATAYASVQLTGSGLRIDIDGVGLIKSRVSGSVNINPGVIVKANNARIELEMGTQLLAEGTTNQPIIFTSLFDTRFGVGGTFNTSTNVEGVPNNNAAAGNWAGIIQLQNSNFSLDHAVVAYAGGSSRIEGTLAKFNPIEIHEADARITNTRFEFNAGNQFGSSAADRNGRGAITPAVIYVIGSQPIIVGNEFFANKNNPDRLYDPGNLAGETRNTRNGLAVISINANSLSDKSVVDRGRSTGAVDRHIEYDDNFGPLVRDNRYTDNTINGMIVRGEVLTTESVWDDSDIAHVLFNEILVPNFHSTGGLRLMSDMGSSLVVKLYGTANAGFTTSGTPMEYDDRIGGSMQVIGVPGYPVIFTSLQDDTVGSGFDIKGQVMYDTNNTARKNSDGTWTDLSVPQPADWRSIKFERYSHDRNVMVVKEFEKSGDSKDMNGTPETAQYLGYLAPDMKSGDDKQRLGFEVHGNIRSLAPGEADVYRFTAQTGTEIWVDIDWTGRGLDTVIEIIDADGNILASSDNSFYEGPGFWGEYINRVFDYNVDPDAQDHGNSVGFNNGINAFPLSKDAWERTPIYADDYSYDIGYNDKYSLNTRDAGLRYVTEGPGEKDYYVRIRSVLSISWANSITKATSNGKKFYIQDDKNQRVTFELNFDTQMSTFNASTRSVVIGLDGVNSDDYAAVIAGAINNLTHRANQNLDVKATLSKYSTADTNPVITLSGVGLFFNPQDTGLVTQENSSGSYQLQLRLQELDEIPGCSVAYADIRYAINGIEAYGFPQHSPILGEVQQSAGHSTFQDAQQLGNLLNADRNTISVAGYLSALNDVNWYTFDMELSGLQNISGVNDFGALWSTIFDIDYADAMSRPDLALWVFDQNGALIYMGSDSNISDDRPGPLPEGTIEKLTAGSVGQNDPFIGPALLTASVEGSSTRKYYVAVTSRFMIPDALGSMYSQSNPNVRVEPVDTITRVAEEHVNGGQNFGTGNVAEPERLTLSPDAYHLGDVVTYLQAGTQIYMINPSTGAVQLVDSTGTGGNAHSNDIAMRFDGRLSSTSTSGNAFRYLDVNKTNFGTGNSDVSTDTGIRPYVLRYNGATPVAVESGSGGNNFGATGFSTNAMTNSNYGMYYAAGNDVNSRGNEAYTIVIGNMMGAMGGAGLSNPVPLARLAQRWDYIGPALTGNPAIDTEYLATERYWAAVTPTQAEANSGYWRPVVSTPQEYDYPDPANNNRPLRPRNELIEPAVIPDAPSNLASVPLPSGNIQLSWDDTVGATEYLVQRQVGNNWETINRGKLTTNTFEVVGLTPGAATTYRVLAANGRGISPAPAAGLAVTAPNPAGLTSHPISRSSLTWDAVDHPDVEYAVEQMNADGEYEIVAEGLTDPNYIVEDLQPNVEYTFRISWTAPDSTEPAVVDVITETTGVSALLSWNSVADPAAYYIVEQWNPEIGGYEVVANNLTGTTCTVDGLQINMEYTFRVSWASPTSTPRLIDTINTRMTSPESPTDVRTGVLDANNVTVSWDSVSGATRYVVQQLTEDVWITVSEVDAVNGSRQTVSVGSLTPDTRYEFRVIAGNAVGDSTPSVSVSVVTSPPGAPFVSALAASASSIQLSWNAVAGATGYIVEIETTPGVYQQISPAGFNDTTFVANWTGANYADLTPGTRYTFRVSAISGFADSPAATLVSATTVAARDDIDVYNGGKPWEAGLTGDYLNDRDGWEFFAPAQTDDPMSNVQNDMLVTYALANNGTYNYDNNGNRTVVRGDTGTGGMNLGVTNVMYLLRTDGLAWNPNNVSGARLYSNVIPFAQFKPVTLGGQLQLGSSNGGLLTNTETITGLAFSNGNDLYAVSDIGAVYRMTNYTSRGYSAQAATTDPTWPATISGDGSNGAKLEFLGFVLDDDGNAMQFSGLSVGPQTVENGIYKDAFFGTTSDGKLFTFKIQDLENPYRRAGEGGGQLSILSLSDFVRPEYAPAGFAGAQGAATSPTRHSILSPLLANGNKIVAIPSGVTGVTFSPIDYNLWHWTNNEADPIYQSPSTIRSNDASESFGRSKEQASDDAWYGGGQSWYFGLENPGNNEVNGVSTPRASESQPNASWFGGTGYYTGTGTYTGEGVTSLLNTYNAPGGAYGSLSTNSFSLADYTSSDKPSMYFSYKMQIDGETSATNAGDDALMVFVSTDNHNWERVSSSTYVVETGSGTNRLADSDIQAYATLLKDNQWRQERVDLSRYAGQKNVQIKFVFSTAGGQISLGREDQGGTIIRSVSASRVLDNRERNGNVPSDGSLTTSDSHFTIDGVDFRFSQGYSLYVPTAPGGQGRALLDQTITINGKELSLRSMIETFMNYSAGVTTPIDSYFARLNPDEMIDIIVYAINSNSGLNPDPDAPPVRAYRYTEKGGAFSSTNGYVGQMIYFEGVETMSTTAKDFIVTGSAQDKFLEHFDTNVNEFLLNNDGSLALDDDGNPIPNPSYNPYAWTNAQLLSWLRTLSSTNGYVPVPIRGDMTDTQVAASVTFMTNLYFDVELRKYLEREADPNAAAGDSLSKYFNLGGLVNKDPRRLLDLFFVSTQTMESTMRLDVTRDVTANGGAAVNSFADGNYVANYVTPQMTLIGKTIAGASTTTYSTSKSGPFRAYFREFETANDDERESGTSQVGGSQNANANLYSTDGGGVIHRSLNNTLVGFYLDNIIIGAAERGEMVTNAPNNTTTFTQLPSYLVPGGTGSNSVATRPQPVLHGAYQLEIRRAAENVIYDRAVNNATPLAPIHTNERLTNGITIVTPLPSGVYHGQKFSLSDGVNKVEFVFLVNGLIGGAGDAVQIWFRQTDTLADMAQHIIDAINLAFANKRFKINAGTYTNNRLVDLFNATDFKNGGLLPPPLDVMPDSADYQDWLFNNGENGRPIKHIIYGPQYFEPVFAYYGDTPKYGSYQGSSGSSLDAFLSPTNTSSSRLYIEINDLYGDRRGDTNLEREKGQLNITGTSIMYSSEYAIRIANGSREMNIADGPTHPGGVMNQARPAITENNDQQDPAGNLVPGISVSNNVLAFNNLGGVKIDGELGTPSGPKPFVRVVNNTIYGMLDSQTGTGVDVGPQASPTIMNNIFANLNRGIAINDSSNSTVAVANVYQNNAENIYDNIPGDGLGEFDKIINVGETLFVDPAARNFYLAENSKAIDAATTSLEERMEWYTSFIQQLGIPKSAIYAPDYDIYGQTRKSDVNSGSGGSGSSAYVDIGAIDRVDIERPTASIITPEDNGPLDRNSDLYDVFLVGQTLNQFVIQLSDIGIGIDDLSVADSRGKVKENIVTILERGWDIATQTEYVRKLELDVDFFADYNASNDQIFLTPTRGRWNSNASYTIQLDNDSLQRWDMDFPPDLAAAFPSNEDLRIWIDGTLVTVKTVDEQGNLLDKAGLADSIVNAVNGMAIAGNGGTVNASVTGNGVTFNLAPYVQCDNWDFTLKSTLVAPNLNLGFPTNLQELFVNGADLVVSVNGLKLSVSTQAVDGEGVSRTVDATTLAGRIVAAVEANAVPGSEGGVVTAFVNKDAGGNVIGVTFDQVSSLSVSSTNKDDSDAFFVKSTREDNGVRDLAGNSLNWNRTDGESYFTVVLSGYDYGDAGYADVNGRIVNYPTMLSDNGARHIVWNGYSLGKGVTIEPDGQPNQHITTDTGVEQHGDQYEDGVTAGVLIPGQYTEFTFSISSKNPSITADADGYVGYINAFFDWNQDGVWNNDASERMVWLDEDGNQQTGPLPVKAGINKVRVFVPKTAVDGEVFARFRLSTEKNLAPTGLAPDGEVEDYKFNIALHPKGFGDAPEGTFVDPYTGQTRDYNYQVTLENNGAWHAVDIKYGFDKLTGKPVQINASDNIDDYDKIDSLHFGAAAPNATPDGRPSINANSNPTDDGIDLSTTLFVGGQTTQLQLVINVPEALKAYLAANPNERIYVDAWFDFMSHGTWDNTATHVQIVLNSAQLNALEMVAGSVDKYILSMDVKVPQADFPQEISYARFRISTSPIPGVDGPERVSDAIDGEVEDFRFFVMPYGVDYQTNYAGSPNYGEAKHQIVDGFQLGTKIKNQFDPVRYPNVVSTLDEGNDGVTFGSSFAVGDVTYENVLMSDQVMTLNVNASKAGRLYLWIDVNGDGKYDAENELMKNEETGEYYFDLQAGNNDVKIKVVLPQAVARLQTGARFRFTDSALPLGPTGVLSTGELPTGEVEDYRITIIGTGSSVSGVVYNDSNANGYFDYFEVGKSGVKVQLLKEDKTTVIAEVITNYQGSYTFDNMYPGEYYIYQTPIETTTKTEWIRTNPSDGYRHVTLGESENLVGMTFGNFLPGTVELGDATVVEGHNGYKTVQVPVYLTGSFGAPIEVTVTPSDGTAIAGHDYVGGSSKYTFSTETDVRATWNTQHIESNLGETGQYDSSVSGNSIAYAAKVGNTWQVLVESDDPTGVFALTNSSRDSIDPQILEIGNELHIVWATFNGKTYDLYYTKGDKTDLKTLQGNISKLTNPGWLGTEITNLSPRISVNELGNPVVAWLAQPTNQNSSLKSSYILTQTITAGALENRIEGEVLTKPNSGANNTWYFEPVNDLHVDGTNIVWTIDAYTETVVRDSVTSYISHGYDVYASTIKNGNRQTKVISSGGENHNIRIDNNVAVWEYHSGTGANKVRNIEIYNVEFDKRITLAPTQYVGYQEFYTLPDVGEKWIAWQSELVFPNGGSEYTVQSFNLENIKWNVFRENTEFMSSYNASYQQYNAMNQRVTINSVEDLTRSELWNDGLQLELVFANADLLEQYSQMSGSVTRMMVPLTGDLPTIFPNKEDLKIEINGVLVTIPTYKPNPDGTSTTVLMNDFELSNKIIEIVNGTQIPDENDPEIFVRASLGNIGFTYYIYFENAETVVPDQNRFTIDTSQYGAGVRSIVVDSVTTPIDVTLSPIIENLVFNGPILAPVNVNANGLQFVSFNDDVLQATTITAPVMVANFDGNVTTTVDIRSSFLTDLVLGDNCVLSGTINLMTYEGMIQTINNIWNYGVLDGGINCRAYTFVNMPSGYVNNGSIFSSYRIGSIVVFGQEAYSAIVTLPEVQNNTSIVIRLVTPDAFQQVTSGIYSYLWDSVAPRVAGDQIVWRASLSPYYADYYEMYYDAYIEAYPEMSTWPPSAGQDQWFVCHADLTNPAGTTTFVSQREYSAWTPLVTETQVVWRSMVGNNYELYSATRSEPRLTGYVTFNIIGDSVLEADEYFNVKITGVSLGTQFPIEIDPDQLIGDKDTGIVWILNDDGALDYGDLPDSFLTSVAKNGPRHLVATYNPLSMYMDPNDPKNIGRPTNVVEVDSEVDGRPGLDADGDNKYSPVGKDDEQGVYFGYYDSQTQKWVNSQWIPGQKATITIDVTDDCYLNSFVDWNANGQFGNWNVATGEITYDSATDYTKPVGQQRIDERFELLFDDTTRLDLNGYKLTKGTNVITFTVPRDAKIGSSYARFRVSSTGDLSYFGYAADGEVEDYAVKVVQGNIDPVRLDRATGVITIDGSVLRDEIVIYREHPSLKYTDPNTKQSVAALTVQYNGVMFTFNPSDVTNINFDGVYGADSVLVYGLAGESEIVTMVPYDTNITQVGTTIKTAEGAKNPLEIRLINAPYVTFDGGTGATKAPDLVTMFDSTENDSLVMYPDRATLSGTYFSYAVLNVNSVNATSRYGYDTVWMYGTTGRNDRFTLTDSNVAYLRDSESSYLETASGFKSVYVYNLGGSDNTASIDQTKSNNITLDFSRGQSPLGNSMIIESTWSGNTSRSLITVSGFDHQTVSANTETTSNATFIGTPLNEFLYGRKNNSVNAFTLYNALTDVANPSEDDMILELLAFNHLTARSIGSTPNKKDIATDLALNLDYDLEGFWE